MEKDLPSIKLNDSEMMRVVTSRVEPHINDVRFYNYSLLWMAIACYSQGMLDMMENPDVAAAVERRMVEINAERAKEGGPSKGSRKKT